MKTPVQISLEIIGPLPVPGQRKWAAGFGKQDLIIKAMKEYASQEVETYREKLKQAVRTEPEPQDKWSVEEIIHLIDNIK